MKIESLVSLSVVGLLLSTLAIGVAAQSYPARPIRLIVPFPGGGGTDTVARVVSTNLSEKLGQTIVIDNRPGAASIIGTSMAAKAPSDGYTLLVVASAFVINPSIYHELPYDTIKDFAPVSLFVKLPLALVVNPSMPVDSVRQLIVYAKARPGTLNFGSGGNGTPNHLAGELFQYMAGLQLFHVPYKGIPPALNDLMAGRIQLVFMNMPLAVPQIKSGKLKALAVTGSKRSTALPNVSTVDEAGVPGYEGSFFYGMVAPRGTPRALVAKLARDIAAVLKMPSMRDRMMDLGGDAYSSAPEEFENLIKAEIPKWAAIVKQANIRIN